MIVNLYSTLRQAAGKRQIEIAMEAGSTLRQLVDELVNAYPALRSEMIDPDNNLYSHIHIFINGRDNIFLDGSLDTIVHPDDVISIFPPVGGG